MNDLMRGIPLDASAIQLMKVFPPEGEQPALELLLLRQQVWTDGRQSLRYWLRKGTDYRYAERIVAKGLRPQNLSRKVAERLFVEADNSSQAAFDAAQDALSQGIHREALQAVTRAFRDEGDLPAMLQAARDIYERDPAKRAQVTAFAQSFEAATATQQRRFNALMLYILVNLLRSQGK